MKAIPITLGGLARLTGKSEQELTETLFESVEGEAPKLKADANPDQVLEDAVSAKLAEAKKHGENLYKRGQKERGTRIEKALEQHFQPEGDLEPEEYADALVKSLKATKGNPTPDNWKDNPEVKEWVNQQVQERTSTFKTNWEQKQSELEAEKAKIQAERHKEKVDAYSLQYLNRRKWNLSDDEGVAQTQTNAILSQIPYDKTRSDEKGRVYFVDSEGNPDTDNLGNIKYLDSHLDALGTAIGGFNVVDPKKSSPGAKNGGSAGDGGQPGLVISSDEQYQRLKSEAIKINSVADRMKRVAEIEKANAERRKAQS